MLRASWGTVVVAALSAAARAQSTTRVSVGADGKQGNLGSYEAAISADGRIVAFSSASNHLVDGDTNGATDVFVRDLVANTTERVSVNSGDHQGNDASVRPSLSADGRYVAFESNATNLGAGDTNGQTDVFVRDRVAGTTRRVSLDSAGNQAEHNCFGASISADGQHVAFVSDSSNLVAGDTNGDFDVFVRDRTTGTTIRVSVDSAGNQGNGASDACAISADGAFVAFQSAATNLVPGDGNARVDVFVHEIASGTTTCVSVASDGTAANGDSGFDTVAISADGAVVAFASAANNLVDGDQNYVFDVFVHDVGSGVTERVSVAGDGSEADNGSFVPSLSADGNVVAFQSGATNLVEGDVNRAVDVFLRDRVAATTALLSQSTLGNRGDDLSFSPALSGDASRAAWSSNAGGLVPGDTNHVPDVFLTDRDFVVDPAAWSNYGTGLAGSTGVPQLVASAPPVFDTTIDVDASDSSTNWTVGFLVVGLQPASLPFEGGTLLVTPLLITSVPVSPWGWTTAAAIPRDDTLVNLSVFAQMLELDPAAPRGVALSAGLELHFGW